VTRVPFAVSRLAEFCNRKELINQTGHDVWDWPLVVLKELLDNSLDECGTRITVIDNGRGIPAGTIERVLDYSVRVSSREAYASPTRGAQGNALKTILPMGYVLHGRSEEASSETVVEAKGVAHRIEFSVDHIKQEPRIGYTTAPSPVEEGTRITINLPDPTPSYGHWIENRNQKFLELAQAYTWLNPHLSLQVTWNGTVAIDATPSDPVLPDIAALV
jgi:DNA topoisomerase VI subunit B